MLITKVEEQFAVTAEPAYFRPLASCSKTDIARIHKFEAFWTVVTKSAMNLFANPILIIKFASGITTAWLVSVTARNMFCEFFGLGGFHNLPRLTTVNKIMVGRNKNNNIIDLSSRLPTVIDYCLQLYLRKRCNLTTNDA